MAAYLPDRTKLTPDKKEAFITALSENGIVARACAKVGISRTCAYAHRLDDEAFREAWDGAVELGTEALIDVAKERAMEMSDSLMIFMLKNLRPAQFRDRRDNVNQNTNQFIGKDGQPIDGVAVINLSVGGEGEG